MLAINASLVTGIGQAWSQGGGQGRQVVNISPEPCQGGNPGSTPFGSAGESFGARMSNSF